ncbi:MAG: hypothetical protein RLZ98_1115 [Pseudomonadota bacterium]|jgi:hypothetical protein
MAKYQGGCLCGAIRYEIDGEPAFVGNCHCDDCRKATGAAYSTNAFFKETDVSVTKGAPKRYHHTADSGNTMTKEFCDNCGAQVFGASSGRPGLKNVRIGSFDDVGNIRPQVSVYVAKALPFIVIGEDTKNFDKMPTG